MKIEKVSKNTYRVRKTYKNKVYPLYFDHKPTQNEVIVELSNLLQKRVNINVKGTFGNCLDEYIENKSNVLSPSTINGYMGLKNIYPDELLYKKMADIDAPFIQHIVNDYAKNHSAKTTRNYYGLISAVLKTYRPETAFKIRLPQKNIYKASIPTSDEVKAFLKQLEGTPYHIVVQLCILGLRRSEACGLTLDDLQGNTLYIHQAKVVSPDGGYVTKQTTKNMTSTREIYVPDKLVNEIKEAGYIYEGYPNSIIRALHRAQDAAKVPRCRLHDLRHYYVSYAHSLGMNDATIMASGGWQTDGVMKRVYRHSVEKEKEQKRIADNLL